MTLFQGQHEKGPCPVDGPGAALPQKIPTRKGRDAALQIGCAVLAVAGITASAAVFILAHFILKYW